MQQETKQLQKGSIRKITITEGRVTALDFNYKDQPYHATLSPTQIQVDGVGKYDRDSEEMLWKTKHVCGASGFSTMLGDSCPSCSIKSGYTKTYEEARNFEPRQLPKALAELSSECVRLEDLLRDNGFL